MEKIILMIVAIAFMVNTSSAQKKRTTNKVKAKIALEEISKDSITNARQDSILTVQKNAIIHRQDSITACQNAINLRQDSISKFKQEFGEQIDKNEKSIVECRVKIATERKKVRINRGLELAKIEQQNINLRNKLESYQENGQISWTSFQIEFNFEIDGINKAIYDFKTTKTN